MGRVVTALQKYIPVTLTYFTSMCVPNVSNSVCAQHCRRTVVTNGERHDTTPVNMLHVHVHVRTYM